MLTDSDFTGSIENYIANNHVNAEYSVSIISKQFADRFRNMDNPYMQERSADIIDISERLIGILSGSEYKAASHGKVIIAAEDLSPSETASFNRDNVLGFIIKRGSSIHLFWQEQWTFRL